MVLLGQIPDPTNVIDTATGHNWEAGVLAFIIVAVFIGLGVAIWRFGWYFTHRLLGNEEKGTNGIVGDWVETEKAWREAHTDTLKKISERLDSQTEVSVMTGESVKAIADTMKAQMELVKEAQEAAMLCAEQSAAGKGVLGHIDSILKDRTSMIQNTANGVSQLKGCAFHLCDMCQAFVQREFPNSAPEVSAYLMAIKKKINDEVA